jgi:hypothetical protein
MFSQSSLLFRDSVRTKHKQPWRTDMNRDTLSDLLGVIAISVTAVLVFSLPSVMPVAMVA